MAKYVPDRNIVEGVVANVPCYLKVLHAGKKEPVLEEGGEPVGQFVEFTVKVANVDRGFSGMEMKSVGCR